LKDAKLRKALNGFFLSVFMLMGIDFGTKLAFGIFALTFGVILLAGWLTPVRLNHTEFVRVLILLLAVKDAKGNRNG
jgi:hypothetical protein